jgi:heme-degrading monooxygenase HmoA
MFVLHIDLKIKQGSQTNLVSTFAEQFYPAIAKQGGFVDAQLLRPDETSSDYRLSLCFDQQSSQQKWVATDLHQEVWPLIADLCDSYAVAKYTSVQP